VSKPWIEANALIVFLAVLFACIGGGCAHESAKPIVIATPSAPNVASTPCAFFADMFSVSTASFIAHHATAKERAEILHWSAKVSVPDRKYLRWMRMYGLIVFVAHPDYERPNGWYSPWKALNTNVIVDPIQCDAYAYPTA